MTRIEKYEVTLTSDSDGDASETLTPVFGKLLKIVVENDSTDQPSDNWDLTVYQGTASGPDYDIIFVDATVSQVKTAAVIYYPLAVAAKAADGGASTLSEVPPVLHNALTITGANMGDTKNAQVKLIGEVA